MKFSIFLIASLLFFSSACNVLSDNRDTFSIKIVKGDSVFLNEKLVSIDELKNKLLAAKKRNPDALNNFVELNIVGEEVTMGVVSDVKAVLRQTEFLKVRYKSE